ncbi:hypothetical protein Cflav_PD3092 [Pedosphaera parvula Ellin514]|uniref:Uncharacterized protein n=2 Tax=Pedosphaera TaxID=1032526 RepID=B9XJH2_PEDPL|nr:hypothetical protein Cflav_PD3092 [Pedosphaera parvula Ellin514]
MADYQCFPLWEAPPGTVGNINPKDLPLSNNLRRDLAKWAEWYDSTLNLDDPAKSGFPNESIREEFKRTGEELGRRLKEELCKDFAVDVKVQPHEKGITWELF